MMEECFLTSLPTALPYIRQKSNVEIPKNENLRFAQSQPISPLQAPLSRPIKPPPLSANRSRPKQTYSKPILDDLTLLYLEDMSNNSPPNLEDCLQVRQTLKQMLDYHLSRYQYQDATFFSKALIQIDAEIFQLENDYEITQTTDSKSTIEKVVSKFINEWDIKYIKFLDFCKKENQRLQRHHQNETQKLNASLRPNKSSPRFIQSPRSVRRNRPSSLNILQPSDLANMLSAGSPIKKTNKGLSEKRDALNQTQHNEINDFVKFSNESRIMMVQTRKKVVNDYFNSIHHESQSTGITY